MTANEIRFPQQFFVHYCAGLKRIEVAHIDDCVTLVKGCVIKSALWQPSNQRHLSTFKAEADAPAGTRLLTFGPLPAGFPVPRTFTAAKVLYAVARSGTGPQVMKPQHLTHPFHRGPEFRAL